MRVINVRPHVHNAEKKGNGQTPPQEIANHKNKHARDYILDLTEQQNKNNTIANQHEEAAILDLSQDARENLWGNITVESMRAGKDEPENKGEGPVDETRKLTRKLVAAKSQLEVQDVLAEVHKNMMSLQMAAAQGDKKAAAIVRKLNKLISRGHRKMRDLSKEQQMMQRRQRAEKKEQEQIAKKIREDLKRIQRERKQREQKYLNEKDDNNEETAPIISGTSHAATEAKIMALAQAKAAMTSGPGTSTNSTANISGDPGTGAAIAGSTGGGEAAIAGGDAAEAI